MVKAPASRCRSSSFADPDFSELELAIADGESTIHNVAKAHMPIKPGLDLDAIKIPHT
jgi:hypothetical protein